MGVMVSPLRGADGNVEFLAWFRAGPVAADPTDATDATPVEAAIAAATNDPRAGS
jgi:hypothetical protein